jgi:DNA primase
MGRFGDNAIEEVRQRADIVEVIGAHVRLRRAGRNFVGLCPFHNEKTPSFSVSPERGFFHCFGCGAGGSVFNFVMRVEGLSFPEAVRSLARRYGVSIPEFTESGPGAREREALSRANQLAADFFFHVLWNTPNGAPAREYLKERGVDAETARAFMLGFAPSRPGSLAKALERRGLAEAGVKLGLVKRDGGVVFDAWRSRLIFPIRDAQGRVLAFGARVLDDRIPKYLNSPESPLYSKARTLYGLYEARQAIAARDRAIVVEGYFDVIALWQTGFKETVASCGTSLTPEQIRVLARYTKDVMACFDGDEAGRKASIRALEVFLQAGLLGRAIFIPTGFDPDTLVRERGVAALEELVSSPRELIDFFLQEKRREASKSDAARHEAARQTAELFARVSDPVLLDVLRRKAGSFLEAGELAVRRAANQGGGGRYRSRQGREAPAPAPTDAATKAQAGMVALALLCPTLRAELRSLCPPENFEDGAARALFEEACSLGPAQGGAQRLMGEGLSPQQQGQLAELALGGLVDDPNKARKLAADYVAAMAQQRRRREIEQLKSTAAMASGEGGADAAARAAQAVIERKHGRDRTRREG